MKNVYIHIPFCKQKCRYCSFVSYPALELKQDYINALKTEIKSRYNGELLETLYFGGGTPSVLTPDEFESIVSLFKTDKNTEITAEFNPETCPTKDYPITRISIGCQTFDDDILKYIGRRHCSNDVITCVKSAQKSGFDNISLDFIYGLPHQTLEMFETDLKKALELGIQHTSLYGLKIDENCYFGNHKPENLPDNDIQADMYLKTVEVLTSAGFEHYEISNFAKPDFYSRHNLNYWNDGTYYGFGVAAHGYEISENSPSPSPLPKGARELFTRYCNTSDLKEYINNPTEHEFSHVMTCQEMLEETIFLGFRKMSGINVKEIDEKFGTDFKTKYKSILDKYSDYLQKTPNGYKLTLDGVLISNNILSEFIDD